GDAFQELRRLHQRVCEVGVQLLHGGSPGLPAGAVLDTAWYAEHPGYPGRLPGRPQELERCQGHAGSGGGAVPEGQRRQWHEVLRQDARVRAEPAETGEEGDWRMT